MEATDGDAQNQLLPKKIEAFAGQRVLAVSAGASYSIALTAEGAVWSWGEGGRGCLGHGEDLSKPASAPEDRDVELKPPCAGK